MTRGKTTRALLPKVRSLGELYAQAARDARYARLLVIAAANLGGPDVAADAPVLAPQQAAARRWLDANANETTEPGVVAEVNYCRDLVPAGEEEE